MFSLRSISLSLSKFITNSLYKKKTTAFSKDGKMDLIGMRASAENSTVFFIFASIQTEILFL